MSCIILSECESGMNFYSAISLNTLNKQSFEDEEVLPRVAWEAVRNSALWFRAGRRRSRRLKITNKKPAYSGLSVWVWGRILSSAQSALHSVSVS
ncbi:hypothetical protein D3C85_1401420 [compost metagenome]